MSERLMSLVSAVSLSFLIPNRCLCVDFVCLPGFCVCLGTFFPYVDLVMSCVWLAILQAKTFIYGHNLPTIYPNVCMPALFADTSGLDLGSGWQGQQKANLLALFSHTWLHFLTHLSTDQDKMGILDEAFWVERPDTTLKWDYQVSGKWLLFYWLYLQVFKVFYVAWLYQLSDVDCDGVGCAA